MSFLRRKNRDRGYDAEADFDSDPKRAPSYEVDMVNDFPDSAWDPSRCSSPRRGDQVLHSDEKLQQFSVPFPNSSSEQEFSLDESTRNSFPYASVIAPRVSRSQARVQSRSRARSLGKVRGGYSNNNDDDNERPGTSSPKPRRTPLGSLRDLLRKGDDGRNSPLDASKNRRSRFGRSKSTREYLTVDSVSGESSREASVNMSGIRLSQSSSFKLRRQQNDESFDNSGVQRSGHLFEKEQEVADAFDHRRSNEHDDDFDDDEDDTASHGRPEDPRYPYDADEVLEPKLKPKKSKMEKIRQLQAKNELYKEEFKRVQKDRKNLRKELESKNRTISELTYQIEEHMSEMDTLQAQLTEAFSSARTEKQQHHQSELRDEHKSEVLELKRALRSAKAETEDTFATINDLTSKISELESAIRQKDTEIQGLYQKIEDQNTRLEKLRNENVRLAREKEEAEREAQAAASSAASLAAKAKAESHNAELKEDQEIKLREENNRLQEELGSTLERAAAMVKEREEAISDLLRENEHLKSMAEEEKKEEETNQHEVVLNELREELASSANALEETQDRVVELEEEVDSWLQRGKEMEGDITRLVEDVGSWQQRAADAEERVVVVEENLENAREELKLKDASLDQLEARQLASVAEMEIKLRAAQLAVHESEKALERALEDQKQATPTDETLSASSSSHHSMSKCASSDESSADASSACSFREEDPTPSPEDQQAMLEKALEKSKKKINTKAGRSGWFFGKSDSEELTPDQKKIRELESTNADQAEEILKLKSEIVRLRSSYNETNYVNKKRLEHLQTENKMLQEESQDLQNRLKEALGIQ